MQIAIIDDMKTEQDYLASCIRRFCAEHQLMLELSTFSSGTSFLQKNTFDYDIIFLDIYMDDMNGLETARHIRQYNGECLIVFTTNSKDFALESYRVRAFDYVVKPFTYDQISETLILCGDKLSYSSYYVEVKSSRTLVKVLCRDIIFVDYSNHYIHIHTPSTVIHSKMYFTELKKMLDPYPQFLYCNRNCIINMNRVTGLDELGFKMDNGDCIPMKTSQHQVLKQAYADYIFKNMTGAKL